MVYISLLLEKKRRSINVSDNCPCCNRPLPKEIAFVDPVNRKYIIDGKMIHLTKTQVIILNYLYNNRNKGYIRCQKVYDDVWPAGAPDTSLNNLRSQLSHFRRKCREQEVYIPIVSFKGYSGGIKWMSRYKEEIEANDT